MKTIQATEVLDYYDGIEIFAGRDAIGGDYLGLRIDISGEYDRYAVVGVRPERLREFRAGALDLRDLLLETPGGEWYVTVADMSYGEPMCLEQQDMPLEQSEFLPLPGFTLDDAQMDDRRLIEEWLPIREISIENIREAPVSAMPAPNYLHVWWARRPLAVSRAAVAASLLDANATPHTFLELLGTYPEIVSDQATIDFAKLQGNKLKPPVYRNPRRPELKRNHPRAFTHNLTQSESAWLLDNLAVPDPLVLDITAGGGSIPFEAGRLGIRTHANELNPVAALILRATCQWPQIYGRKLRKHYGREVRIGVLDGIIGRYLARVRELLQGVYPGEEQPEWMAKWNEKYMVEIDSGQIARAKRYVWSYLFARAISCPSCGCEIPLSPNWRLDSRGKGIRLLPNERTGRCGFEIVETAAEQSSGTVNNAIATCPYPDCGSTTSRGYIAQEAQAGRLGHRLYAIIMRDQWQEFTKAGVPKKRLTTERHFRVATPEDDNSAYILSRISELRRDWDASDILPNEAIPEGNKTKEPHRYGMPYWIDMFSPRQQLALGYCVQAFRELVDEDEAEGELDDTRKAAWAYVALAIDKLINRNSLMTRWVPRNETVVGTFDSHDFGFKWSYAEMAVAIRGLGLEWALNEVGKSMGELVEMSGYDLKASPTPQMDEIAQSQQSVATPSVITVESADFLLSNEDRSVDAIVFDPPYYDNVSYAELSDFFYVWLKRTAGYVYPEWFADYLTDKGNEAVASPARFRNGVKGRGSVKRQSYADYVERMRRMFTECRRVIKDDGIVTIMFTHKTTEAWDALTIGIIEAGFRVTATWPVKTESDSSLNIRDRAAARSTILLICRPKTERTASSSSWEQVERQVALAVQKRIPELESYDLNPLDIYLASFGPALEVISSSWPIRRELANPERPNDPFGVTPNDALQVARREVFDARRQRMSDLWANNPGDALTEFYILAQDNAGSATIPFDEANMMARCLGLELTSPAVASISDKKGSNINLLTGNTRFARGIISPAAPTEHHIDRVHTAIALAASSDVNNAINWCIMQGFADNPSFKGALEALLLVMKPRDPDMQPARTLWTEMYKESLPEPEGVQTEMALGTTAPMSMESS